MTMKKRFLLCALLLFVLTMAATLLAYPHLPATVPVHWNAAGDVDRYGARGEIFTLVAVLAGVALLWRTMPSISPHKFGIEGYSDTYWYCGIVIAALLAYVQGLQLWAAIHGSVDIGRALAGGIGGAIVLLGNVMGKVKRNFWLGVRTPWTLASERVWYATHRLAGKTMVAGGLVMAVAALAGLPFWVGSAGLFIGALAPALYSLVVYKRLEG
jgi:uncharacterized membrane protein